MSIAERLKGIAFRSRLLGRTLRVARVFVHWTSRRPHEADFYFLADARFAGTLLLDLGANIGQSAISARRVQPKLRVLSIEANPACGDSLLATKWLLGRGFSYQLTAVGAESGTLPFYVPVRSSRMLLEEGTFLESSLDAEASRKRNGLRGRDFRVETINVPVVTVDSLSVEPAIVKMDLQGYELQALLGMVQTLRRSRPVFIVERGRSYADMRQLLEIEGYTECSWKDGTLVRGGDTDDLNAILVPPGYAL